MQDKDEPLVSIVALNYNNSAYVLATLESISNQLYSHIELIIVDDCSTDDGLQIIDEWLPNCKFPVTLIKHEKNRGVCAVCNSGLQVAKGKYIAMLATDDIICPTRIKEQVEELENTGLDICAVFSDMLIINENGLVTGDSYFNLIQLDKDILQEVFQLNTLDRIAFLIKKNIFPAPSMLYKKEAILKVGGWDEGLFFEDLDMNLRLTREGYKFLWLTNKLVEYRFTQVSMSRKPSLRFLESHLNAIYKYKNLSKKIDYAIDSIVANYAEKIYEMNSSRSSYWLKESFLKTKSKKSLAFLLFSIVGIKYNSINKIKSIFKHDSQ